MKNIKLLAILLVLLILSACGGSYEPEITVSIESTQNIVTTETTTQPITTEETTTVVSVNTIPDYSGSPYIVLNNNKPEFTESEITTKAFEKYSELDNLSRCGVAFACLGIETMPTEERGEIGMIKPSGWHLKKYDCVDGKYLYNRCHLIGFQLSGENANDKNLITGTRYLNIEGMLPFENMVDDYIEETNNHVMYRVTPIFEGDNLLCKGVKMEALSVEDDGEGISFNVFCYNTQPSIKIDYKTGESYLIVTPTTTPETSNSESNIEATYILNTNSKKFHTPSCSSVNKMSDKNKQSFTGDKNDLIAQGYSACGICKP
jgi:DNA-entry nuclease